MYIARHFVRVNGKMFTPGEVITENIPDEKAAWLLGGGAVSELEDAPDREANERGPAPRQKDDKPDNDAAAMARENHAAQMAALGYGPDGMPAAPEDAETDEDDDDEAEAPEIDVTDGIVAEPEPEEAPAPRKRSSKKK